MKRLIATRADSGIEEMCEISHPILKVYASKCKADFHVISENKGIHPHFRILQFIELFEEYDYILSVDSDVLIKKDCPDIFDIVPDGLVGTIYEDVGSRKDHRRDLINKIQNERGDVGWKSGYINTGFALFPASQKGIFNRIDTNNLWLDFGLDDVEICYQIHASSTLSDSTYQIYELPFQFNHMTMHSEPWNNNADRFDSWILHYAGRGIYDNFITNRLDQMKQDYFLMKKYNMI